MCTLCSMFAAGTSFIACFHNPPYTIQRCHGNFTVYLKLRIRLGSNLARASGCCCRSLTVHCCAVEGEEDALHHRTVAHNARTGVTRLPLRPLCPTTHVRSIMCSRQRASKVGEGSTAARKKTRRNKMLDIPVESLPVPRSPHPAPQD